MRADYFEWGDEGSQMRSCGANLIKRYGKVTEKIKDSKKHSWVLYGERKARLMQSTNPSISQSIN